METFGKYRVVEHIASGGFGEVYKGYDPMIKRSVAIKTCGVKDERTRRRFALEAEIAGNLHHRNITTVYDYGVEGETPYLVQELLVGEDLDRKIERREEISYADKLTYLTQIARGLEHSHNQGVVHRDLKPANVHILPDGTVKIMDFGIARLLHQETGLTVTGQTVGTTAYLAPEQIRGEELDERVDIFAFGVLAYELVTYERAFRGDTISSMMFQIVTEEPESIRSYWPDCPVELLRLIERCLDKDPDGRPREFGEIVGELERIRSTSAVQNLPAPAPVSDVPLSTPPPQPAAQAVDPGRTRTIFIAVAGLALLGIGTAAWLWLRGEEPVPGAVAEVDSTTVATGAGDAPVAPVVATPEPASEPPPPAAQPRPEAAAPETPAARPRQAPAIERYRVTSSPPGARIWLDGQRLKEPATAELVPGASYRLRLELDDHQSVERQVSLESLSPVERRNKRITIEMAQRAPTEEQVAGRGDAPAAEPRGSDAPPTVASAPAPTVPPAAPAAVTKPTPPAAGDPSVAIAEIRKTLQAYQAAYRSFDVAGIRSVWPSIDAVQLEANFSSLHSQGMSQEIDLDCREPALTGERASVSCRQRVTVGSTKKKMKPTEKDVEIELEKTGGYWVIRSLRSR